MKLPKFKELSTWKTESQPNDSQLFVIRDNANNQSFESFYRQQYSIIAAKYTFLTNQQLKKRILNMWKTVTQNQKLKKSEKSKVISKQKNRCGNGTQKPGMDLTPSKTKVLVPLEVNVFPAPKKGALKRFAVENESTKDDRHVSFNSDTEIRYRTASEDSSVSNLTNKSMKKSTNTSKGNEISFSSLKNCRSYINGSRKKRQTDTKFDILLNEKCSWSYKSLKTSNNDDIKVMEHSFLQMKKSEATVSEFENDVSNLRSPSLSGEELSNCSDQSFSISLPNTIQMERSNNKSNSCYYDYDEIDQFDKKIVKKTVKKRNKERKVESKPTAVRSLRNKKRVDYRELDTELDLNDEMPVKGRTNKNIENKIEINMSNDEENSNYSDEGLIFQTRFSDKNAKVADIASSIESNESSEIMDDRHDELHVTTTPLILKLDSPDKQENKQKVNKAQLNSKWNPSSKELNDSQNSNFEKKHDLMFNKSDGEDNSGKHYELNANMGINLEAEINSVFNELELAKQPLDDDLQDVSSENTNNEKYKNFNNQEMNHSTPIVIENEFQWTENISNRENDKFKLTKKVTKRILEEKKNHLKTHPKSKEKIPFQIAGLEENGLNSQKGKELNFARQHQSIKSSLRNDRTAITLDAKYEADNSSFITNSISDDIEYSVVENKNGNFNLCKNHTSNAISKELAKSPKPKQNSNMYSDMANGLININTNALNRKQKLENTSLITTNSENNLNIFLDFNDDIENEDMNFSKNLCKVKLMEKDEKNKFQNKKTNVKNSLVSKKNNSFIKTECLPEFNEYFLKIRNEQMIAENNTENESFQNKTKPNEMSEVVKSVNVSSYKRKNTNTNKNLERLKTWDDLEAKLLADEDNNLQEITFLNEEIFTSFEMHYSPEKNENKIKRVKKYWKQGNSLETENTYDFPHKETENKKHSLFGTPKNSMKNKSSNSTDFSQNHEIESPNLSIVNKTLAAMERCTAEYLPAHKVNFQSSCPEDNTNDVSTDCNFILQKFESTYIKRAGKNLCIAEKYNNYIQKSDRINKPLHLEKYRNIREIKSFNNGILQSNHTITSRTINAESKVDKDDLEEIENLKIKKCSNTLRNFTQSGNVNKVNIPNEFDKNIDPGKNTLLVIENVSQFNNIAKSPVEEISQNRQPNFSSMNNTSNRYNFRKRKQDSILECKDKIRMKEKQFKSELKNKNCDNLMLQSKKLNKGLTKYSKTFSQNDSFDMPKMDSYNKKASDTNAADNYFSTDVLENISLDVDSKEIKASLDNSFHTLSPINDVNLEPNKIYMKSGNKINKLKQRTNKNNENSIQEQITKTNLSHKKADRNTKDDYVKYLKTLFQTGLMLENDQKVSSLENGESILDNINRNSQESRKKLIVKSDDDLFSISSSDSEFGETSYHLAASQSQLSCFFSDVLDE